MGTKVLVTGASGFIGRRLVARPVLTTEALVLLASRRPVPINRAERELGYRPMSCGDALDRVAAYVRGGAE